MLEEENEPLPRQQPRLEEEAEEEEWLPPGGSSSSESDTEPLDLVPLSPHPGPSTKTKPCSVLLEHCAPGGKTEPRTKREPDSDSESDSDFDSSPPKNKYL